jgi:hypothetical protein
MKKSVLPTDELARIGKKYLPQLLQLASNSFYDYLKFIKEFNQVPSVQFKEGEICNFIQPFFRARASAVFLGNEDVLCKEFNGVFGILIESKVLIRFNKINEHSEFNSDTKQSEDFVNQILMKGFHIDPTLMVLGFEPNKNWTDIFDIRLICRIGHGKDNIVWMDGLITKEYKEALLPYKETGEDEDSQMGRVIEK